MKIEAVVTMIIYGIAPRFPDLGITVTLMDHQGRMYKLVFFGKELRGVFDAIHIRKLHQARGKKVYIEFDQNENPVAISGYYYPGEPVPCNKEFSACMP